jgi:predicted DNA-binding transcriptional regulator AlpA
VIDVETQLLDAAQLAAVLNMSEGWLKRKARLDEIPHIRLGRAIRFQWPSAEMDAWLESQMRGN